MKALRCLLVDDEPPALTVLSHYVSKVEQLELAGTCAHALEALEFLRKESVDILFLDIQMPQLLGTQLLRILETKPAVILTTAYTDYAVEGYELEVSDYLVKPISFERFLKAVNRVMRERGHVPTTASDIPTATQPGKDNGSGGAGLPNQGFLFFRSDRKMVKVFLDEILYVESLKDYVRIYRQHDRPLLVKQSISSVEDMLPAHRFVRIHRSYIVSLDKVKAYSPHEVDIADTQLPIGKSYGLPVFRQA